jgi:hypothetical protein
VLGVQGLVKSAADFLCEFFVAELAGGVEEEFFALDFLAIGEASSEGKCSLVGFDPLARTDQS